MRLLRTAIMIPILFALACAPEATVNELGVQIEDEQPLTFSTDTAYAKVVGNEFLLGTSGMADGNRPLTLNVVFDYSRLYALSAGTQVPFNGDTWFTSEEGQFNWFAGQNTHNAVLSTWIAGGCTACQGNVTQNINGVFELIELTDGFLRGSLTMSLNGIVPAWGNEVVEADFEVMFELHVQQDNPEKEAPTMDGEVTLWANMGANFETGLSFKKANFANSDLYATAGHKFMKLTPGGNKPTTSQPIRWWANAGGSVQTFNSLEEVPWDYPTDDDASQSLVKAKPGVGFVILNNLSNAYTRVWIRDAGSDYVTLRYELVYWEE